MEEKKDKIFVGKNCSIDPSVEIIGPVIIDENCVIKSTAKIGPNVSIGKNSYLEKCSIRNSIVMDDCIINSSIKIVDSIIADGSEIENSQEPKKCQFLLGERSHLKF